VEASVPVEAAGAAAGVVVALLAPVAGATVVGVVGALVVAVTGAAVVGGAVVVAEGGVSAPKRMSTAVVPSPAESP